jgi:DNA-3-methyladenine glycosylase
MRRSIEQILRLPAIEAAPLLLGSILTRHTPEGSISIRIVETEAYHQDDPASHTYRGLTKRTAPMFEAGGRLYVYFTYGMHYCMNIVVGQQGIGEGVLLRAGEPIEGLELMRRNRNQTDIHMLASGPGRFAQAFGIRDTLLSGKTLTEAGFTLRLSSEAAPVQNIVSGPRVGIRHAVDNPWRFYLKDNPFVSGTTKRSRMKT